MSTIDSLRKLEDDFNQNLQDLVSLNAKKESNDVLIEKAKDVEMDALRIFSNLNNIKRDACKK